MNKFLTDEQNEKEVNTFFLKQKKNKQNFYKDLLYSQYENTALKNKNIFGTEDILILQQKKKKIITENPYREKNEYGFGNSNLKNNPILNPENNMRYNKYFKDFYPDINDDKTQIENNNNNINNSNNDIHINVEDYNNNTINIDKINNNNNYINNNVYKNNYINNEKEENNMVINGSNIINNYKINNDIANYKTNNNNGLSRNYSDIYQNYKALTKNYNSNYNIINNIGNRHKFLDYSKRSMSQIQI